MPAGNSNSRYPPPKTLLPGVQLSGVFHPKSKSPISSHFLLTGSGMIDTGGMLGPVGLRVAGTGAGVGASVEGCIDG